MLKKNFNAILFTVILGAQLISTDVSAATITVDWSTVSLSGTFPSYSFNNSALGTVSLTYSSNASFYGIDNSNTFAGNTLLLGTASGVSLTISWTKPTTNMNMELWDVDANEVLTFTTQAALTPVSLTSNNVWDTNARTLSGDGTDVDNTTPSNYTVMNFSDSAGFNSVTFGWSNSAPGGMGIGQLSEIPVPVPLAPSVVMLMSGMVGLLLVAVRPVHAA